MRTAALLSALLLVAGAQAQAPLDQPTSLRFVGAPLSSVVRLLLESRGLVAANPEVLEGSPAITLERHNVPARTILMDVLRCAAFDFVEQGSTVTFAPHADAPQCTDITIEETAAAVAATGGLVAGHTELAMRFDAAGHTRNAEAERVVLDQIAAETSLALTSLSVECRDVICRVQATGAALSEPPRLLRSLTGYRRVIGRDTAGRDGVASLEVFLER